MPPAPPPGSPSATGHRRRWRRRLHVALLRRRRALAALLLLLAVAAALRAVAPPAPATVPVAVAARDLAAGRVLAAGDVVVERRARAPAGALAVEDADGSTLAGPVREGEALTDARVTGPGLAAGFPGDVTVPVRIPDPGVVRLLRVGDEVDVLASARGGPGADDPAGAHRVASGRVAALPPDDDGGVGTAPPGLLVLLAVPPHEVDGLVAASAEAFLQLVWSD